MTRRNPMKVKTASGRERATRVGTVVRRVARPLSVSVVATRDGGADVLFEMRNGDTLVAHAPNTYIAMLWLNELYGSAANDRLGRPVAFEVTVNGSSVAVGTTQWGKLLATYLPREDTDTEQHRDYRWAARQIMQLWLGDLQGEKDGDKLARLAAAALPQQIYEMRAYDEPRSAVLRAFEKALDGYGIEGLNTSAGRSLAEYVNTGDTYSRTVLWDNIDRKFLVTTWGDFLEYAEAQGYQVQ